MVRWQMQKLDDPHPNEYFDDGNFKTEPNKKNTFGLAQVTHRELRNYVEIT
jgi:hypothetical protein